MTIRPVEMSDLPVLRNLVGVLDDSESFAEKWLGGWPREKDHEVLFAQAVADADEDCETAFVVVEAAADTR